ncbi:hypothetical protein SAMN05216428_10166 [Nitrosospira sp. Nsp11]|uniref:hypothetical protein n=1 Tax=Nitrosospira sp. Nsp11 TaxID=1855338 RepID=UPI000919CDD5|nr:hypothetical protein [Nitrosospira sp. Nsp11]SHL09835.1 hypothetical protein SAMN05216428_10166 [Nitrosospira sp. Nsp11]
MRHILLIIVMALMVACGVPPIGQKTETPIPVSPVIEIHAPRTEHFKEAAGEPKVTVRPKVPEALAVSPCVGIDTGDIKETIKSKLDCISEHNK